VCNVATQPGETAGFDLAGHVEALVAHSAPGIADIVLANNDFGGRVRHEPYPAEPVRLRWPPDVTPPPRLVLDEVVDPENAHHHDPGRLTAALVRLLEREGRRRPGVARTA
jgi:hypothetical protein